MNTRLFRDLGNLVNAFGLAKGVEKFKETGRLAGGEPATSDNAMMSFGGPGAFGGQWAPPIRPLRWKDGKPVIQTNAQSPFAADVFGTIDQARAGEINWGDVSSVERKKMLTDPNFYKSGEITKFQPWMQQQILADPDFDWNQLPAWQQLYYSASSNPAAMGAIQGGTLGITGGYGGVAVGGAVGALIGWAAGVLGYDQTKEFWQQGDENNRMDIGDLSRGAFGLLNFAAEQAEKAIGTGAQMTAYAADPNKNVSDLLDDFGSTWNANASFFEAFSPAYMAAANEKRGFDASDILSRIPLYALWKVGDAIAHPEKYKGEEYYLGAADPFPLDQSWLDRIDKAREEIKAGRNYREVMTEMQTGIIGQLGDMVGQAVADPLNFVGKGEAKAGEIISRASGDKVAETAFKGAGGFFDAKKRLQNIINTPGEAAKIDPNFRVDEMGAITRMMSGLTDSGKVRAGAFSNQGLLDYSPPKKNLRGYIDYFTNLLPEARAREGQDLLMRNIGGVMSSYFGGVDVEGFAGWWNAFRKGDMTQAAELSTAMAGSPEVYTVMPAARNFDVEPRLRMWQETDGARQSIVQLADMLGENPQDLIADLARNGTAAQDLARVAERLRGMDTPEAKSLLAEIDGGKFTADMLAAAVKLFSSGEVPFHPAEWMAQTLNGLKEHYDKWAVEHFKLDEESRKTLFRLSNVMKSMQSILLLGANPGYMISNVLPTMAVRAMDGVWGYMTEGAIDAFMKRMGYELEEGLSPSRLDEGVGPGGLADQARGEADAIRNAVRGDGLLSKAENFIGRIGRAMPFNRLSRLLEGYEGRQAYVIGMRQFMGENWRRGRGYRNIPTALAGEITRVMGQRGVDLLHAAIEGAYNKSEVQAILSSTARNLNSRSLIHDAAGRLNIPTSRAAQMLEQMGVLDALDRATKKAGTEARVRSAFERVMREAKQKLDEQAARDATANIEHVANRMHTEGMKAVTDIVLDVEEKGIEQWLQHYERMGEAADAMETLDAGGRAALWSYKYAESAAEYRRFNAHKGSVYLGVLKAVGLEESPSARGLLSVMADSDRAIDGAYRTMRELRDGHFTKWNGDWDNPRRGVERAQIEKQIEQAWADATKAELENSAKIGELLGRQYDELFGVEAGEAARQAWESITEFRGEMTKRRDDFRKSLAGMNMDERKAASRKFWGETYKYMIVEMERIKREAITKLDDIANRRRGGTTGTPAPTDPNPPSEPPNAPAAPDEIARLRQQAEERQAAIRERLNGAWEQAAGFGYNREKNAPALMAALRKYGDADLMGWDDPRLTADYVREALQKREQFKAKQQAAAAMNAAEIALNRAQQDAGTNFTMEQALADDYSSAFGQYFDEAMAEADAFNAGQWDADVINAIESADLNRLAELIEELPAEMGDKPYNITGETYNEFASRTWDEVVRRITEDEQRMAIAENMVRAEEAIRAQQATVETGYTRQQFYESLTDVFRLSEEEAAAVMEITDARAAAHGDVNEWYRTRIAGVERAQATANVTAEKAKDGVLEGISKRRAELIALGNLNRDGYYGIIDAAINEKMPINAEFVESQGDPPAGYVRKGDVYVHEDNAKPGVKGGVRFLEDGRAIIRAFEEADVSTVIHEIGHIFRRDLDGADLLTVEEWAGVRNGEWNRAAEEKFARGFERYMADGSAPNLKLKRVFEKFKQWMLGIYRAITGSPLDVELTPAVREVFDRMLMTEGTPKTTDDLLYQSGFDPKTHTIMDGRVRRRPEFTMKVNRESASRAGSDLIRSIEDKLQQVKGTPRMSGEAVDVNVKAPGADVPAWQMTFDEYSAMLLRDQREYAQGRLDAISRGELDGYDARYIRNETEKMRQWLKRETISYERYGDARERYLNALESALADDKPVDETVKQAYYEMKKSSLERMRGAGELYQEKDKRPLSDADPRMPLGGYEEKAGWMPQSEAMNELWGQEIAPLLEAMQDEAIRRLNEPAVDGAFRDLSPEGQEMLRQYMKGVEVDLASTKMGAARWGQNKRDTALLNYNRRTGIDQMLDVVFPYQFFYTRSMMTYAMRALDNPAILANYARLRRQQDRYENNLPERLRGKVRVEAPYLPDWMGDALYIDPLSAIFTPHNFLRPFEQMMKDENYQTIEAERILQEWAREGTMPMEQIQEAVQSRSGKVWEQALTEAKIRREAEISNPLDFVSATFGPAWYLSTPAKLLGLGKDGAETISELPLTRTARAFDTVTEGSWLEGAGNLVGLLAKPEEYARKKLNLPEMGEYGDYYIDRQLSLMVAEGKITSEDAIVAMIERSGALYDEAKERTKMELAMRVPLAGATYAGLQGGPMAALGALPASLFGAGLLPEGELEYRGLKQEWNEAWKLRDAGDTEAVNRFFAEHPEYEAYLAKGKEPEDRLRSFLVGQIWDGYMALGETNKKQARAEMGDEFSQAFLNSETRSYDTLDIETLTQWAQMLDRRVPKTEKTLPALEQPKEIDYFSADVTNVTDVFFEQRKRLYPNYFEQERKYYALPASDQALFLINNPEYAEYVKWRKSWYKRYPDLVPVFNGQVFKRIDTSQWSPLLLQSAQMYALLGEDMPPGARKALNMQWVKAGKPRGNVDDWLKLDVAPALLYGATTQ